MGDMAMKMLEPFHRTIFNDCPGGICKYIHEHSEVFLIFLSIDGLFFLLSLFPPCFTWSNKRPNGKKRLFFSFLAWFTFYFWLAFLALNSVYCFGFVAHKGPCRFEASENDTSSSFSLLDWASDLEPREDGPDASVEFSPPPSSEGGTTAGGGGGGGPGFPLGTDMEQNYDENHYDDENNNDIIINNNNNNNNVDEEQTVHEMLPTPAPLLWRTNNVSCATPISEHEADLRNMTVINVLIIIVLLIVLIANAKEVFNAKALDYNETICKKEEVQKFLSTLVAKPPEVGHYVSCFHPAKTTDQKSSLATRKVITFSAIENFDYQSWRDFSDLRLIEPSPQYPIIEIEIVLNFFPGDHFTAEKYKGFVVQLTKEHSGKDAKINIDDYFHIEDQREWTFFIGNSEFISPWWERGCARVFFSCFLLIGWIFRMGYHGKIAKHRVELKKAVYCENSSQDEGVSLSATPGSSSNETQPAANPTTAQGNIPSATTVTDAGGRRSTSPPVTVTATQQTEDIDPQPQHAQKATSPLDGDLRHHEQRVNAVISDPPPYSSGRAHHQTSASQHSQYHSHSQHQQHQQQHQSQQYRLSELTTGTPPLRSVPLTSPRTHMRETTKDIVTAVTHQDINGVSAVNTVALKDIDVQMNSFSGYETYV